MQALLVDPAGAELARDCYYDGTPLQAAERYAASDEWSAICGFLPAQAGLALDLGAGRGIASFALARSGWQVQAVEPDSSALVGRVAIEQIARTADLPIKAVPGTGERLPFDDSTFDLVFARQALHHAADLRELCREAARVLKPGARLIAVREHVLSRQSHLQTFLDAHPLHRLYGGENAYTMSGYRRALGAAGLDVEVTLASFDSVINYAPYTRESLRQAFVERLSRLPGGEIVSWVITGEESFDRFLRLASRIDRRPGRLYTFVCRRRRSA